LTAAHCCEAYLDSDLRIVAGEFNLQEDEDSEQAVDVEEVIIHPGWGETFTNADDICLLKLAGSLDFNE